MSAFTEKMADLKKTGCLSKSYFKLGKMLWKSLRYSKWFSRIHNANRSSMVLKCVKHTIYWMLWIFLNEKNTLKMSINWRNYSWKQQTTIRDFADRLSSLFGRPNILKDNLKLQWDACTNHWQKYLQNRRSSHYTPLTVATTVCYCRDRLNWS